MKQAVKGVILLIIVPEMVNHTLVAGARIPQGYVTETLQNTPLVFRQSVLLVLMAGYMILKSNMFDVIKIMAL